MGQPEVAGKMQKPVTHGDDGRLLRRPDPGEVHHETSRTASSSSGAPPGPARVAVWWPKMSPTAGTRLA